MTASRTAHVTRHTSETRIELTLTLDGEGRADISTGLGFYDHMLTALTRHGRLDLSVRCQGDTHVDDHHTVEDVALALGAALEQSLGDKRGLRRFGSAYAPLDEALARSVIDLSGRPFADVHLGFTRERIGEVATENLTHFFVSLAAAARMTLHVDTLKGSNDHHKAEAAFKATALALRAAIAFDAHDQVPSTKGTL